MVTEIAIIDVKPGSEGQFAADFRDGGHKLLITTPGCLSSKMFQSHETSTRFIGVTEWESTEAHLRNFVGTDRFAKFSELLGPHVASLPVVEHFDVIAG
ncbi:MAG TPA: antibiotic biosynthesis monooxygenase family protein [Trebonia sp.]|jgi:heme-degrading monooxygenase HmoA|nr:antibiotic biosynthesis monooxygenase family protein [Trebonia sp.]